MKFTVDRKTWLRGEGSLYSRLLRYDNKQCCLGFLAGACDTPKEAIFNQSLLENLFLAHRALIPSTLFSPFSEGESAEIVIAKINDDPCISDTIRESLLTNKFNVLDIQVEFIN